MTNGTASGDELLRRVVRAELALRHDDQSERFRVRQLESHRGAQIVHNGLRRIDDSERNSIRCDRQDLEDLAAAGFIRLERHTRRGPAGKSYEEWEFDVTKTGFERITRAERAAEAAAAAAQKEAEAVRAAVEAERVRAADAAYASLQALLDERVEYAASEEERSKWERLRDAIAELGRDEAIELLGAAAQNVGQSPGHRG